jgi:maltooligosyltrehalose trehalohydrolase
VLVIVEDARNLRHTIEWAPNGSWGADGVWSDDFHHQMRRALAGDADGYFADFTGSARDTAATIRQGWFFTGQASSYFGTHRGTDPTGLPLDRFVFFLQNHDQVGNRAFGDRLHHKIAAATWRAVSVLLLMLSETPLLFMGQEWAATTPFLFFTDHHAELGRAVTAGRRSEFSRFAAFADPALRQTIPDPQDAQTFMASQLVWDELEREPHRSTLALYRRLLQLRRSEPALRAGERSGDACVHALGKDSVLVRHDSRDGTHSLLALVRLCGAGMCDASGHEAVQLRAGSAWRALMHSEEPSFTPDQAAPDVDLRGPRVMFARPGAVLLVAGEPR